MKTPTLNNIKIIPEEMIVYCASQFGPEEENSFKQCLEVGNTFKKAGLTPVYLCKEDFMDIYVTTKEKLTRKYH